MSGPPVPSTRFPGGQVREEFQILILRARRPDSLDRVENHLGVPGSPSTARCSARSTTRDQIDLNFPFKVPAVSPRRHGGGAPVVGFLRKLSRVSFIEIRTTNSKRTWAEGFLSEIV